VKFRCSASTLSTSEGNCCFQLQTLKSTCKIYSTSASQNTQKNNTHGSFIGLIASPPKPSKPPVCHVISKSWRSAALINGSRPNIPVPAPPRAPRARFRLCFIIDCNIIQGSLSKYMWSATFNAESKAILLFLYQSDPHWKSNRPTQ